jgi:peptidoglycan/xylan/chitin deacetylase (PgdA/CDA1 family)
MRRFPVRAIVLSALMLALLALAVGAAWRLSRQPAHTPLSASGNLLPNPGFQEDVDGNGRPDAWELGPAASWADWTITPQVDGHSLRLTGSASYARSAPILVRPQKRYQVSLQTLADAPNPSRLQVVFLWEDTRREVILHEAGAWQEVPSRGWRLLTWETTAPADTSGLSILVRPAGDDPVYLDDVRLSEEGVRLEPFPDYRHAALAFTLDWETAMGGLIHSRSDDGYDPATAEARGLAMRQGSESLLDLFAQYGIRATWYASGYSLLTGNTDRETFGQPIYTWASRDHGWRDDRWVTTPWFADDPYGTAQSNPAWYFGDLLPRLRAAGQEIQSHTFGHLYLGYATPEEVRADLRQWNAAAVAAGLSPATTLAFPWGASLGMSDATFAVLEELGYRSVTRTYHEPQGRSQYYILPPDDLFHMRTVPGRPALWAFPDHYFPGQDAAGAKSIIDQVLALRGVTSLWAHTEEAVSPAQIAAWDEVLAYAAAQREAGLWIAPVEEIVAYRDSLGAIVVQAEERATRLYIRVRNDNDHAVAGLTLTLPAPVRAAELDGEPYADFVQDQVRLPRLNPRQQVTLEITQGTWEDTP